ncbi:PadR family transcriptional regulator [Vibrio cincinnatiensis]|uniref:PadR family transcriptional regulator n=1 Tax=Vibrio cincinnatiensis TaxID=675 RepID=UPI001EE109A2|nr:PadR family transcriptional regulator [Vibrio cincinnatiensis]
MSLRYIILIHINERPLTGYGVTRKINQSNFWTAVIQQTYRELKVLLKNGWIEEDTKQNAKNQRGIFYSITESGKVELEKWISSPTPTTRTYDLISAKLMAYDLAPKAFHQQLTQCIATTQKELNVLETEIKLQNDQLLNLINKKRVNELRANLDWYVEVQNSLFHNRLNNKG